MPSRRGRGHGCGGWRRGRAFLVRAGGGQTRAMKARAYRSRVGCGMGGILLPARAESANIPSMCGRMTLSRRELAELADELDALPVGVPPRPTAPASTSPPRTPIPSFAWTPAGQRQLEPAIWGFAPSAPGRPPLFNARAETAPIKDSFRGAFVNGRCVVPADGFYEWAGSGDARRPFWLHRADGKLLLFAGLYEPSRRRPPLHHPHHRTERHRRPPARPHARHPRPRPGRPLAAPGEPPCCSPPPTTPWSPPRSRPGSTPSATTTPPAWSRRPPNPRLPPSASSTFSDSGLTRFSRQRDGGFV